MTPNQTLKPAPRLLRIITGNLQVKILLLVLVPLVISSISLLVVEGRERSQATESQLERQRALLIESRQQSVRELLELSQTMIASIQAAEPDTQAAQRLATSLLDGMRFDESNYIFAFTLDGDVLVQPAAPGVVGTNMLEATDASGNRFIADMAAIAAEGGGFYEYDWMHPDTGQPEPKYSYAEVIPEWEWVLGAGVYITDIEQAMAVIASEARSSMIATFIQLLIITFIINLAIFAIAYGFAHRMVRQIRQASTTIAEISRDVAAGRGDLTRRVSVLGQDEVGQLSEQFNELLQRMQWMLTDVRHAAEEVSRAAQDIAQGSNDLASRTDQTAANLQETSSAMEQITATVENNAMNAQRANQLAKASASVANHGEEAMRAVETTMADINTSSVQISDIVTMIDGIAFQTNILALNASVEAARAGEHGRGFAVVAQEVRSLAQRSAESAREIRALIKESVNHSTQGAEIVQRAGETMHEIVTRVTEITDVVGDISAGSQEQSTGISEVNLAVNQLDTMTQQNAALVAQSSSAASQMLVQAERLRDLIGGLELGDGGASHRAPLVHQPSSAPSAFLSPPAERRKEPVVEDEWESF